MGFFPDTDRGAVFSPCKTYRYKLWRIWDDSKPLINFLMLNPSTADEKNNDPTVERCEQRARQLKYGGLYVTNLFAYRSTDPKALFSVIDPVGPDNDEAIRDVALLSDVVVVAWGSQRGLVRDRANHVCGLLHDAHVTPHALKVTKDGDPCHPLYLSYNLTPAPWYELVALNALRYKAENHIKHTQQMRSLVNGQS